MPVCCADSAAQPAPTPRPVLDDSEPCATFRKSKDTIFVRKDIRMKALVVGGGIAGPAAALALAKAGIESEVLERRPVVDPEAGSWLTVAPNGLDALQAMDVLEEVRDK